MNPVHTIEADLLGACLLDPVAADRTAGMLNATDFEDPKHRAIFAVIAGLVASREPINRASVLGGLQGRVTELELFDLECRVTSGAYANHHAKRVLAASNLRAIQALCATVAGDIAHTEATPENVEGLLQRLRFALDDVSCRVGTKGPISLWSAGRALVDRLNARQPLPSGIRTGFLDLDYLLGGMRDGEMIVLAARPSVGKSLFASNVCEHVVLSEEKTALCFSMEMRAEDLYQRYVLARARVDSREAVAGRASPRDIERVNEADRAIERVPWYVDDRSGLNMAQVYSAARNFQNKHGHGIVVLDYLQIMRGEGAGRYEMVTNLSNDAKRMATDLRCPVVVLAQLNRAYDKQMHVRQEGNAGDKKVPQLSDLRDSGAIEQDADVVIFLSRDTMQRDPHICDVTVAKNRPGKTGNVELLFDTTGPMFRNYFKDPEEVPHGEKA